MALVGRIRAACTDQDDLPPVRVGLHRGPVVRGTEDVFGDVVNVAARVTDQAAAGEVLATTEVTREVRDPIDPLGAVALRGVGSPIARHQLHLGGR